MSDWLVIVVEHVATIIQVMALVVVVFGSLEAFAYSVRAMFRTPEAGQFRSGYIRFARWLIVALTFQLAADVVETAVAPDWDAIGQLAAIAAIRAFINYFLERDLEVQERARHAARAAAVAAAPSAGVGQKRGSASEPAS